MQDISYSQIALKTFAANYDCAAYGSGNYNEDNCVTGSEQPSGGEGGLAGTGFDVIMLIALALALITAAGILIGKKIYRRLQAKKAIVSSPSPWRDERDDR